MGPSGRGGHKRTD